MTYRLHNIKYYIKNLKNMKIYGDRRKKHAKIQEETVPF